MSPLAWLWSDREIGTTEHGKDLNRVAVYFDCWLHAEGLWSKDGTESAQSSRDVQIVSKHGVCKTFPRVYRRR